MSKVSVCLEGPLVVDTVDECDHDYDYCWCGEPYRMRLVKHFVVCWMCDEGRKWRVENNMLRWDEQQSRDGR